MPDYSSDCFFLQTTILTLIGPLFRNNPGTTKPSEAKSRQGKLSPKGSSFHFSLFQGNLQNRTCLKGPLWIFFGTVQLFSKTPQMVPFEFFDNLHLDVNKSRRVRLLHFSALCDFFERNFFF